VRGHCLPEFSLVPVGFCVRGELADCDVARPCGAHTGKYTEADFHTGACGAGITELGVSRRDITLLPLPLCG
jgi:hypothetical protein